MKKLFAMIALIFTIGMTVDFSPGDSPPDQTEFSISEFTAAIQADGITIIHLNAAATIPDVQNKTEASMSKRHSHNGSDSLGYSNENHPSISNRLDKEIDPGRCSHTV